MNETATPEIEDAEARSGRPSHDPRPFDDAIEEAHWRDLPPSLPPPADATAGAPPHSSRSPRLQGPPAPGKQRRRWRWWLVALLLAALAGVILALYRRDPPPCGERLFIPAVEGVGCIDPDLLHHP